jgi:uncharacterized membrane protein
MGTFFIIFVVIAFVWALHVSERNELTHRITELENRIDDIERTVTSTADKAKNIPEPEQKPAVADYRRERVTGQDLPEQTIFAAPQSATPLPPPPPPEEPGSDAGNTNIKPWKEPEISQPAQTMDWERFSGVKLAAWTGGVTLFLGSAFFVKYSIEEGLISPQTRLIIGFTAGVSLMLAGVFSKSKKFQELRQTLAASGMAVLYAVVFAAKTYYGFVDTATAFILMSLTTAAGCLCAAMLKGKYIAVLASIGGFLTPMLLSTGEDRPFVLFGYTTILDIGLLNVARAMAWGEIYSLSAIGTGILVFGWHTEFFTYSKVWTSSLILMLFTALFNGSLWLAQKQQHSGKAQRTAVFLMSALFAIIASCDIHTPGASPWPGMIALFVINAAQAAFVAQWNEGRNLFSLTGIISYICLLGWATSIDASLLPGALFCFIVFAAIHAAMPPAFLKNHPDEKPPLFSLLMPILSICLAGAYLFHSNTAQFMLWPAVLAMDIIALALAFFLGLIVLAIIPILLTGGVMLLWLGCNVSQTDILPFIIIALLFAAVFFAAGIYAIRKGLFAAGASKIKGVADTGILGQTCSPEFLPAISAVMPYMLFAAATAAIKPQMPVYVFGGTLILSAMLWTMVRFYKTKGAGIAATLGSFLVLLTWHTTVFAPAASGEALCWYAIFFAALTIPPFLMHNELMEDTFSWAGAACAGPLIYIMVHDVIKQAGWDDYAGIGPCIFAICEMAALWRITCENSYRVQHKTRLAIFGGMALLFISLIFPVQFDKQWITLGWALEGLCLVWLYRKVEHEGLKYWAAALSGLAFARLALNPAVLDYHPRQSLPILNWFLYSYGITAAAFACGAKLWRPEDERYAGFRVPAALEGLATALVFLLLNMEIADYFSTGTTLTFQFSGSFALDLTYTIAWGIFAMCLLLAGIYRSSPAARGTSLGLFAVTVLKLFFNDLWQLGLPYRAAAFISLALMLIGVSYFYQRYLSGKGDAQ